MMFNHESQILRIKFNAMTGLLAHSLFTETHGAESKVPMVRLPPEQWCTNVPSLQVLCHKPRTSSPS